MTERKALYDGVSKAAWAYFFLYFDININTVTILPSFVSFLFFLTTIRLLQDEERDLALLRPLAILLAVWHGIQWIASWFAFDLDGLIPGLDLIVSLANLYFHFQLMTNMASLAVKYQRADASFDKRFLKWRTIQTVMLTGATVLGYLSVYLGEYWAYASMALSLICLIAGFCLMKALFDFRKIFLDESPDTI